MRLLCDNQMIVVGYGLSSGMGKDKVNKCDRMMVAELDPQGEAFGCGLRSGDVIMSVNGVSMENASYEDVVTALSAKATRKEEEAIRIVGMVNRVSSLLSIGRENDNNESLIQLKLSATLILSNASNLDACGVYIPQETKNGLNVYQNENGYLLSLEMIDNEAGWVIGKDGDLYYAKPIPVVNASIAQQTSFTEKAMKYLTQNNSDWTCCQPDDAQGPCVEYYERLPSLDNLLEKNKNEEYNGGEIISQDWSPLLQLVAIKGYGFRALAKLDEQRNADKQPKQEPDNYDIAMKCLDTVIEKASVLISVKKDCDVERSLLMNVLTIKGKVLLERKRNFASAASYLSRASSIGKVLDPLEQKVNVMNNYHLALALSNLSLDEQKEALKICLDSMNFIQQNHKDVTALAHFLSLKKTLVSVLDVEEGLKLDTDKAVNANIPERPRSPSPISKLTKNVVERRKRFFTKKRNKTRTSNMTSDDGN